MLYFQIQRNSYSAGQINLFPALYGPFADVKAINDYCIEQWPGIQQKIFISFGETFTSLPIPADIDLRNIIELSQKFVRDSEGHMNGFKFSADEIIKANKSDNVKLLLEKNKK